MREHTIVTISRQYGSGGREVAEILAKKMQVRCYDRQIVYLAAEKIGNGDLDVESILEEAYKVPGSHSGFFGGKRHHALDGRAVFVYHFDIHEGSFGAEVRAGATPDISTKCILASGCGLLERAL
mgnify:CR=1 FL=1